MVANKVNHVLEPAELFGLVKAQPGDAAQFGLDRVAAVRKLDTQAHTGWINAVLLGSQ